MKRTSIYFYFLLAGLVSSCTLSNKMTIEKATKMVQEHPFLKETSVSITDKYLANCDEDLLGSKEGAYFTLRGYTTAYYYKSNGIKLGKVENLVIEDDNTAYCDVVLEPDNITKAEIEQQKNRSYHKPTTPKEGGELFRVVFKKYQDKGWTITDFYCIENRLFKINGWKDGTFIYEITPMSGEYQPLH